MTPSHSALITTIAQEVASIIPYDSLEKSHIANTLQWIASTNAIFRVKKPDIPPKHLVSYFVLIDEQHKSILLCDHIKAQLWLPPGGHVEPGEHPSMAVKREALEELGITASFVKNTAKPFFITINQTGGLTPGHTDVSLWYLIKGSRFDFINFDRREFNDIEWFTYDEILATHPTILDKHMHRFMHKLITHL